MGSKVLDGAGSQGKQQGEQAARACCARLREAFGLGEVQAPDLWGGGQGGPFAFAPSMGIEVEVPWRLYFPQLWSEFGMSRGFSALGPDEARALAAACAELEEQLLPRLRMSAACGVPRGNDRYWEFALDPCTDWRLPCAQLELLRAAGLLPAEPGLSLQITIGGARAGSGAQAMARLLEALCSSPARLASGLEAAARGKIHSGWARKGSGGVLEKQAQELKLGALRACEFRTLAMPGGESELRGLLSRASAAGAALSASQAGADSELAKAWGRFESGCGRAMAGLGIPSLEWERGSPIPTAAWGRYIESFGEARARVLSAWEASGVMAESRAEPAGGSLAAPARAGAPSSRSPRFGGASG